MEDLKAKIDELAELMDGFSLSQGELAGEGWRVAFRRSSAKQIVTAEEFNLEETHFPHPAPLAEPTPAPVLGTPVSSPMTGIFYASPSPSSPPFVKEGESVTAGQVVALIEAMKVFNEIVAPTSGSVLKVLAASGQVVNPGDPLLYIG